MTGADISLKAIRSKTTEIFVEGDFVTVVANKWSNGQGCHLMVLNKGQELSLRMAGSFQWSEIDTILAALTAARSA